LEDITKRFPGVTANDHINISVEKGEIHTLAGENGAGKSTLMNILFGLYRPTEGNIYINGEKVEFHSSKDSIKCGIGMVHQHFMLVPKHTVAENIIAGQEPGRAFWIDRKKAIEDIQKLSDQIFYLEQSRTMMQKKIELVKEARSVDTSIVYTQYCPRE